MRARIRSSSPGLKSRPQKSVSGAIPLTLTSSHAASVNTDISPGRLSHHPLLAVLAEANFVLHSWLRSGYAGASQGAAQFLSEALGLLGDQHRIRCVRADSGFYARSE